MNPKPKHALLRDAIHWEGIKTTRLKLNEAGELSLTRLPAAKGDATDFPGPWNTDVSGLAMAEKERKFISDTDNNRVMCLDSLCDTQTYITGYGFLEPRGIVIANNYIYVTDSGNARVQVFHLHTLELHDIWQSIFKYPTDITADSQGRIYIIDSKLNTVLRFSATGVIDEEYNNALLNQVELVDPAFFTIDIQDDLYISQKTANTILRFNSAGQLLNALDTGSLVQPGALVIDNNRLYIADTSTGVIQVIDLQKNLALDPLPGFRGPVTAMYVDRDHHLHIKTDLGINIITMQHDLGCASTGQLLTGPLDAGINQVWERLTVQAHQKAHSQVQLEIVLSDDKTLALLEDDWQTVNSLDTLLPQPSAEDAENNTSARFLWVRVSLTSHDRYTSPVLNQVHAMTTAKSYLDYLPEVYAREDEETGFLRRWLALFRSELNDSEFLLEEFAHRFDPEMTPIDHLEWLAGWLAFQLPDKSAPSWSIPWLRELVLEAHDIYTRRGTKSGLCEAIERNTGLQVEVQESYRERHIWQLDTQCRLGFDTGLVPARADGAVVPDSNEKIVVGEFVVDQSGPQQASDFAEPLFNDEAHLFSVVLPAGKCIDDEERSRLRSVIDAEKPAYTDYHLCLIEAQMRVGFQARIGIDTIVAGPKEPMALNVSRLGLDSFVANTYDDRNARVGYRAHIGQTMRVS